MMWALFHRRTQLFIIVGLTAFLLLGIQGASEWYSGRPASLLKHVSTVVSVIGIIVVGGANVVWRWLWRRIPRLNHWIFPDLNGTWEGELQTTWSDPNTGQVPGPIAATLTIRQTLFTTNIRLRTGESTSASSRVIAEADRDADIFRLWYSYNNRPKAIVERSARHEGAAWLEISLDEDPDLLTGQHYTDRRTNGDMQFRRVSAVTPSSN